MPAHSPDETHAPAVQVSPPSQWPQASMVPQPSETEPHCIFSASHVVGLQDPAAHTFATPPPPQASPSPQLPQDSIVPQPSSMSPQFLASAAHVVGVHPGAPHKPASLAPQ